LGDERPTTDRESRLRGTRLSSLRLNLGRKAKQEPRFRFYTLYDKVCWTETLEAAWEQVRRNGGTAGVDGMTIDEYVAGRSSLPEGPRLRHSGLWNAASPVVAVLSVIRRNA